MPRQRAQRFHWLLVGLPLAFLTLFFYLPLLRLLKESLQPGITPSPLIATLKDAYFWHLLRLTIKQATLSTLASVLIGLPLGYILANHRLPMPRLWRALTIVPFVLPAIVVALGFILFFGHNGYFNRALGALCGVRLPLLYSLQGIVLAHAFYNAPIVGRTTAVAWESLDPALEQGARALGASPWTTFRKVTWPLLWPATASGALLAFIFSFFSFPLVLALGGARYATLEVEVFTQVRVLLDNTTGAAFALFETIASLALTYLYLRVEARNHPSSRRYGRERQRLPFFRAHLGTVPMVLYLLILALLYAGPIGAVIHDSLVGENGRFSLDAYAFVLKWQHAAQIGDSPLGAVFNTLRFALGSMLLAVCLGTALAVALPRTSKRAARFWETLAMAPLAVSSVAFGYAMLRAYRVGALRFLQIGPSGAIVAAHAILGLPFVLRVLRPHFQSLDRSLLHAARSLGASPTKAFFRVALPLSTAALLVAAAFAFSMSVSEMSATIMLAQPGFTTMPLTIYHLVSAREFSAAAAMAVLLMFVMTLTFASMEAAGQYLITLQVGGRDNVSEL
ncbi:MAG: ABC transporter permease [Limnochordia bacterium]|jgi:thiamine transport system permease protein